MKIACLFAGQGAQYPVWAETCMKSTKRAVGCSTRPVKKIKQLCFEGTAEELKLTENTQPCVYTVTMAAYEEFFHVFRRRNRRMRKLQRWPDSVWGICSADGRRSDLWHRRWCGTDGTQRSLYGRGRKKRSR